ncbi:alcohol dehydrogenase catalytic domain-containing protein [Streptomyces sp. SID7810]|nr:alcohol dehydrogenase catalytic domain-containing protein [Streptomyces sp. SID7810]
MEMSNAHHTTSRSVVLREFNKPLAVEELDVAEAGPGEVVVGVEYGGVCGTDAHLWSGRLDIPTPVVLGHEGLGTVERIGAGGLADANGEPLAVGDTVMWASSISCGSCVPCRMHEEPTLCERRTTYGVNLPVANAPGPSGSWSERMVLRAGTSVVKLPAGVPPASAMSLACAGPTMIHALYGRRPVRLGESVVVQGSGPVGLAAAAMAQLAGAAQVIVVGGPESRLAVARRLGIGDHHIDIIDGMDAAAALAEVRALTGGYGADLVIECAGAPDAVPQGIAMARRGGSYLVVGQYTDRGEVAVNPHQLVHRQLSLLGSWGFTGAHLVAYVNLLPALTARFDLASLVTEFPMADCEEALRQVGTGGVLKAVLRP